LKDDSKKLLKLHGYHISILLWLTLALQVAHGSEPLWWTAPTTSIIDPNSASNNYAPLNLGQLKHVAHKAKEHLDLFLPIGAGSEVNALVASLQSDPASNYAIANLGQLKSVAKPFYDRLRFLGYNTRANLISRGYPADWPHIYPWDPLSPISSNYAPANLGQLKMAFSFDLSAVGGDNNGNGIPDSLEGQADTDGDGLTDAEELNLGKNPNVKDNPAVELSVTGFVRP
jgi:hypothetical protein